MKKIFSITILLIITTVIGSVLSPAQELPDGAALPAGRGAWAVFNQFHSNLTENAAGAYGYQQSDTYYLVLSDGTVYYRKKALFAPYITDSGWCKNNLSNEDMRAMRSAVSGISLSQLKSVYGVLPNVYAPFSNITITVRAPSGKANDYSTRIVDYKNLPDSLVNLLKATQNAGALALSNCMKAGTVKSVGKGKDPSNIESGIPIYVVRANGDLVWYKHIGFQIGDTTWVNDAVGKIVGYSWIENSKIFKGNLQALDGIVYTVTKNGNLNWYEHRGFASGSTDWIDGKYVAKGFNGRHVFSGGNGVIYQVDNEGNLYWYKHLGYRDGAKSWADNAVGKKIHSGWNDAQFVFSGGGGVIYLIDNRGDLYWYKHLGYEDGANKWQERKKIGSGWGKFRKVFTGGKGIIYAVTKDGDLNWYKHSGYQTGVATWTNGGSEKTIGRGWNFEFVF